MQSLAARRVARLQSIQWAIAHAAVVLGDSRYYTGSDTFGGGPAYVKDFIVSCLLNFNRGTAVILPATYTLEPQYGGDKAKVAKAVSDFQTKMAEHLHGLLGEKPVIRAEAGDKQVIISLPPIS